MDSKLPPVSFAHKPAGTTIKASVWLSSVEVPAQEDVLVAQSFLPALVTP